MKKTILFFFTLLPFLADATITPDDNFVIITGVKNTYDASCTIECYPVYKPDLDIVTVDVRVYYSGTQVGGYTVDFSAAHVGGYTGSGSDEVAQYQDCVEQAVIDYLTGLSENSGVGFTN